MALVDEKDIVLDSQGIATWEINMTAPIGGTYQGVFQFRTVLSPIQQIEADRDFRELLGANASFATTHVENLAYTLAQLRQRIIKAPPFWDDGLSKFKGSHIRDEEILQAVYEAAVMAETKFRNQLKEKHKESIERLKAFIERQEEEERLEAELAQEELDKEAEKSLGAQSNKKTKKTPPPSID
jgi:hypothetical protein